MLDAKILKLMFKEEFRLQASFFNRSYFLTSSFVLILFTFIMGLSLPMLRQAVEIDDMLLVAHWIILFYGLAVGGFALFGERILERRFGSISLLLGSGDTLPIRHRRLFFLFYIKDTMYYILLTYTANDSGSGTGIGLCIHFINIPAGSLHLPYSFIPAWHQHKCTLIHDIGSMGHAPHTDTLCSSRHIYGRCRVHCQWHL